MDKKIALTVNYSRFVNFAMQQNSIPVIRSIQLKNCTETVMERITVSVHTFPEFSFPLEFHAENLAPEDTVEFDGKRFMLNPDYLMRLTERLAAKIEIKVSVNGEECDQEIFDIDILTYNEWTGPLIIPELIASFVTPNHPFVAKVLRRAAEKMQEWKTTGAMCGYQKKSENDVLMQMAAIFAALQEENIAYSMPPAGFELVCQKVRLCDDIESQRLGTCLDLSLLYASCLEQAGLNPILVFIKGHAFVACWLIPETFPAPCQDDFSLITKRISEEVGEIAVVECTLFAGTKDIDFDKAKLTAEKVFFDGSELQFFIDIKQARAMGIRPIPQRKYNPDGSVSIVEEESDTDETTWSAPEEIQKVEVDNPEGGVKLPKQRIWQNKLLNLSLRNSLLNFRPSANTIQLVCNDLGFLEDQLSAGKEYRLIEFYEESTRGNNDGNFFVVVDKETKTPLIKHELDELVRADIDSHRLRTFFTLNENEKRVKELYRKAKLSLEENGSNTLFLALGFLRWFETDASEAPRYAPLVLLPLEIVRKSASQGYVIRKRDEESRFNITLLEKLRTEFDLSIHGLDPLPTDDSGTDIKKVFSIIRRAVMNKRNWDIEEFACIGQFSFSQFIMWTDIGTRSKELEQNQIVKGLIDGALPESLPELVSVDTLDTDYKPSDMATPLDADSSQLAAISSAAKGCSFVLHGPPGTGKSQTITNMIANALFNGKSVLFIAEKMAALSVVQNRLSKQGLDPFCLELHSNKANKSAVTAQLEKSLEFGMHKKPEDYAAEAESLHEKRKHLNELMEKIHRVHQSGYSLYDCIGMFEHHPEFNGAIAVPTKTVTSADAPTIKRWIDNCDKFRVMAEQCGNIQEHPLFDLKCGHYSESSRESVCEILEELESKISRLSEIISDLSSKCASVKIDSRKKIEHLSALQDTLGNADSLPQEILFQDDGSVKELLSKICDAGKRRNNIQKSINSEYESEIYSIDALDLRGEWKEASVKWFIPKLLGERKVVSAIRRMAKDPRAVQKEYVPELLDNLIEFSKLTKTISDSGSMLSGRFGRFWKGTDSDWEQLEKLYGTGTAIYAHLCSLYSDSQDIATMCKDIADLKNFREKTGQTLTDFMNTFNEIDKLWATLSATTKMSADIKFGENWTSALQERLAHWKKSLPLWHDWCNYNALRDILTEDGMECTAQALESGKIATKDIIDAFKTNIAYRLIVKYIEDDGKLGNTNAKLIAHEIALYKKASDNFADLTRKELIARLSARIPTASPLGNSSEIGILKKNIKSKSRGVSIRQLFDSIPNLLRRLTPCMLMSPISVAQYIDPKFPKFDLVIFDEASQLPTCEAVGAIARGNSLIVVGDPKQMPPTSFFKKGYTDEDNIEKEDLESILDDCLALSMPESHLLWHYRSKDESLIAFSNYNYYDKKLFTFPSPSDLEGAVKFIEVEGFYDKSKTRQNRAEAERVVGEIVRRLKNPAERKKSIGVVTFNIVQRNLIDDLLEAEFSKDPKLEKWASESSEEIFIKNLESVQGDERDVIIFSVGYGPDASGNVSMNFGPINNAGGWRRLNVAVSRARYEMMVFSTLQPEQIDLNRSSAEGVAGLKAFLTFAKYGKHALATLQGESSKPATDYFKNSVADELRNQGYRVETDVGCSKYKMDLAVVHPEDEKKFILGILCDGQTYKESATAKDRNILQQNVLESLGWNIIRLWSFDWFINREHRERIVQEIKQKIGECLEKEKQAANVSSESPDETQETEEALEPGESDSVETAEETKSTTAEAVDIQQAFASIFKPYVIADISPMPKGSDIYDPAKTEILLSQVKKIIEVEAPISESEVATKVSTLWSAKKTEKFLKRLAEIYKKIAIIKKKEGDSIFFWNAEPNGPAEFRVPIGGYKRDMQNISVREIAFAVKKIVESQISIETEEIERIVAKVAGFTKCTAQMKEFIDKAINWAVRENLVTKNGSRILSKEL